jgi:hypothetical protein
MAIEVNSILYSIVEVVVPERRKTVGSLSNINSNSVSLI